MVSRCMTGPLTSAVSAVLRFDSCALSAVYSVLAHAAIDIQTAVHNNPAITLFSFILVSPLGFLL